MLSYIIQYKFSILLAIVIALLSLVPGNNMPNVPINFMDKIVHFSMYAAFGFVSLLESRCRVQCIRYHTLLLISIFLLSAIIEVLQATVVATRSAEWLDLLANCIGLLSGYVAFRILRMIRS
jgi:VanZ family protein